MSENRKSCFLPTKRAPALLAAGLCFVLSLGSANGATPLDSLFEELRPVKINLFSCRDNLFDGQREAARIYCDVAGRLIDPLLIRTDFWGEPKIQLSHCVRALAKLQSRIDNPPAQPESSQSLRLTPGGVKIGPSPAPAPAAPPASPPSMRAIYFDFDQAKLDEMGIAVVKDVAATFENLQLEAAASSTDGIFIPPVDGSAVEIVLKGYADTKGASEYNHKLSEQRADAVAKALRELGISDKSIEMQAFGEMVPAIPTADGVRQPENRRVELEFRFNKL